MYRRAALERQTEANELHQSERYVLAYYVAGAAVECILHAYRERNDVENTAGHNLYQLAQISGFLDILPDEARGDVTSALADVATRWSNLHRYRSHDALRIFLIRGKLHRLSGNRTVRGDLVRANANAIVSGATAIVTAGNLRWHSSLKKIDEPAS